MGATSDARGGHTLLNRVQPGLCCACRSVFVCFRYAQEAFPLTDGKNMPTDPTLAALVKARRQVAGLSVHVRTRTASFQLLRDCEHTHTRTHAHTHTHTHTHTVCFRTRDLTAGFQRRI